MAELRAGVSGATDELSSELLGDALDLLAEGKPVNVLLVVQDEAGVVASYEFADDGPAACLTGAHQRVQEIGRHGDKASGLGAAVRYALVYEGAVADGAGTYQDALILEFGERGWQSYSAFCRFERKGTGDDFTWTDPAPAGEVEPLL